MLENYTNFTTPNTNMQSGKAKVFNYIYFLYFLIDYKYNNI